MSVQSPNAEQIFNIIRRHGPVSRADIARFTGLTPPTVTNITNKLLDAGLVNDYMMGASSGGRRPLLLKINPAAGQVIIIHIRSFKMIGYVVDTAFGVHFELTVSIKGLSYEAVIQQILAVIDQCRQAATTTLMAVGVVIRGPVRTQEGISVFAPNIGWKNVPLKYIIEEKNRLPAFIENDSHVLAYGEYYFGVAKDANNMVLLKVGHGIGGGIMFNGSLYRGINGSAGEVGHTVIDVSGPLCSCGNSGCMEAMASETALVDLVINAVRSGQTSLISGIVNGDLDAVTAEDIYHAADLGDHLAINMLSRVAGYLGIGIANLVNVFNPELVVIGGGLAKAQQYIERTVWDMVALRSFESCSSVLEIKYSTQTSENTMKGAADMVFSELAGNITDVG
ncbi:ROK family transcriptional regulator [Sporomusa sp.]|uniref:ROK family transcriptional regulator n=1 Tax=Sporomusa sp. TaxID=2078658 RepID=UPI002C484AD3|nr:ROK family transcriptional regulator [Sporomusa sp.]HWR43986.1 ROK family transcriptional regulator [Sporomusa sp.]